MLSSLLIEMRGGPVPPPFHNKSSFELVEEVRRGMEGWTDITIDDRFVIHVIDNRQPAAQCSQVLTPLPEAFQETLKTYILSLLKPRFRRKHYGQFRPDSSVLQEYQRLTESTQRLGEVEDSLFLDVSGRLARLLFGAMQQTGQDGSPLRANSITPGDLLVGMFYNAATDVPSDPCLFVIKVDLETAVQRQIESRIGGGIKTVLTRQEGLLPKISSSSIQKSALIRWENDPNVFDVVMTDPQGGKHGVAKFFADDFLQTEPYRTPDDQAELLFRRTHEWMTEHEEVLSPQERGEVMEAVREILETHHVEEEPITPRDIIEALPLTAERDVALVQELRESYEESLIMPELAEERIPVDRELLIQRMPPPVARTRVTYLLDNGVQLSGDADALADLFVHPPHVVEGQTEFTIRTSSFRPSL